MSRHIPINIERKIIADSMGRCMNPECREELFKVDGDIIEKAHIVAFSDTNDNSYENLIVLCPNCHTNFDKNTAFTEEQVRAWKEIRKKELEDFFNIEYSSFTELKEVINPILLENQKIFNNYYNNNQRKLWDIFENKILSNNSKIRGILAKNLNLFQSHSDERYSNLDLIQKFLLHIDEFEATRLSEEKTRQVLFPKEVNSIFGVIPIDDSFIPSVKSLETLITELEKQGDFKGISIGTDNPYIQFIENNNNVRVFLNDTPRLRQLYSDYNCFRGVKVRLDGLNYVLKAIVSNGLKFDFYDVKNLLEIKLKGRRVKFIYEYCLSKIQLQQLSPPTNSIIVNLHNWNGDLAISSEAYDLAEEMNVKLYTTDDFYGFLRKLKYQ